MNLTDLPMFGLMRSRLSWLNQRQEVISQNLANSDTPAYKARDIANFNFRDVLHKQNPGVQAVSLAVTNPAHIAMPNDAASRQFKTSEEAAPYETAPDGNQVTVEEQMVKMNETQANHNLMTQLYHKQLGLFKMVTRGGGS